MMKRNYLKLLQFCFTIILISALFLACDKDEDNEPDNEQELITTVKLTFIGAGGIPIEVTAKDLDGDGGNPPTIQPIALKANTDYSVLVAFSDESKNPVINLTEEVKTESDEHLVCFASTGTMTVPTAVDQDFNKKPLGMYNAVKTGAAGTGTLKITLKHEPDKSAANPCSTGETDVEQTFNVTISN